MHDSFLFGAHWVQYPSSGRSASMRSAISYMRSAGGQRLLNGAAVHLPAPQVLSWSCASEAEPSLGLMEFQLAVSEQQRVTSAAVALQAVFRGYVVRRRMYKEVKARHPRNRWVCGCRV